jgi:hypothetical protein
MKGPINWLMVAVVGFGLMAFSNFHYRYEPVAEWEDAFMYVGRQDPNTEAAELQYVKRPLRLLPMAGRAKGFAQIARGISPNVEKYYQVCYRQKVILYPELSDDFTTTMLEWGRLPQAGADEVLAGFNTNSKEQIDIDGQTFNVVGQLKRGVRLFANSYLLRDQTPAADLFDAGDEAVQQAHILRMPKEELTDLEMLERLKKAFPKSEFTAYQPIIQTEPGPFYLYIVGMLLLFLGGSLVLFKVYCILSGRIGNKWLRLPLGEIVKYKRLFVTLHLIYFGLVVLFAVVAYLLPELQVSLLAGISSQVIDGSGPLAAVGRAYMSKDILRAAVTTFAINFPFGSVACITLPSIIIPGSGVLLAILRASIWGLLLSPSFVDLSGPMLPHSITLLLEGEAYIMASFFGVLILVYLFRKAEGPTAPRRYGRALLMNVRGNLWVAIVLVVAAVYEAIEVILSML